MKTRREDVTAAGWSTPTPPAALSAPPFTGDPKQPEEHFCGTHLHSASCGGGMIHHPHKQPAVTATESDWLSSLTF